MKKLLTITLTFVLLLILSIGLTAQQSYLCFPREGQAERQTARLNHALYGNIWNATIQDYELRFKCVVKKDSLYCVEVNCEESELTYWRGDRLAIKKRHYKYIVIEDKEFFDASNQCWLVHEPSKLQKFIKKIKRRRGKS